MEYAKLFTSLLWGSVLCIPLMVLVSREVEEFDYLEDYIWLPALIAMSSLAIKTLLEKKQK